MSSRQQLIEDIKQHFGLDLLLFLDFETFYKTKGTANDKSYSLKTMTYPDYILGERFQTTGLGYAFDMDEWTYVHRPEDVAEAMMALRNMRSEGKRIAVVAHNTQFDASIMCWLFGVTFDYYFCTQLMASLRNPTQSAALFKQAEILFPDEPTMRKGKELANYDGVRYEDIPEHDQNPENPNTLASYCVQDNHLLREIFFEQMSRGFPAGELDLMHITLRGAIEPQFLMDREVLKEIVTVSQEQTAQHVCDAVRYCFDKGIDLLDAKSFSSDKQYAELLKELGITVPLKVHAKNFTMVPALGKNDPEYIKAQIANPDFAPVFKARQEVKSTIAETRAKRMLDISHQFTQFGFEKANMPFFLNYYGAKNTGRWSGGQKLNQQNLPRYNRDYKGLPVIDDKAHRLSMLAPEGFLVAVNDLSNIELRVNLWFCGQTDILENFRIDPDYDLYSALASEIYGYEVNKKTHKDERQVGKAGSLGLGYAMSWYGFQQYLAGGPLGMEPMFISDSFAKGVKLAYDLKHNAIAAMWVFLERNVLPVLANGGEISFGPNDCVRAVKDKIYLPSGRILHYPNTKCVGEETRYGFRTRYKCDSAKLDRFRKPIPRNLHKGLLIENIVQALARDVLAWQMLIVEKELQVNGWGWVAGSVHDEILAIIPEVFIEQGFGAMQVAMAKAPEWCSDLPLASEGGYAREYSK